MTALAASIMIVMISPAVTAVPPVSFASSMPASVVATAPVVMALRVVTSVALVTLAKTGRYALLALVAGPAG